MSYDVINIHVILLVLRIVFRQRTLVHFNEEWYRVKIRVAGETFSKFKSLKSMT